MRRMLTGLGRSQRRGLFGTVAAGLVAATAVGGCGRGEEAPPAMPPAQVTYVTIVPTTGPVPYPFLGVSEASSSVDLKARVQGVLHDWRKEPNFVEGKPVAEGITLFQIEPREFAVDIDIAKAKR